MSRSAMTVDSVMATNEDCTDGSPRPKQAD
jgi:hypothetical protein